eukprot:s176_g11.t1
MVSWPRSHGELDFDLWGDGDGLDNVSSYSWTPSEVAAEERRYMPHVPDPAPADPSSGPATGQCRTEDWSVDEAGMFYCMQCGGSLFFNVGEPAKLETATGTWMYVPHRSTSRSVSGGSSHGSVGGSPAKSPAAARAKFPDVPSSAGGHSARAESEAPTVDPVIDPDDDGSRRRRRRRGSSSSSHVPAPAAPARRHGGPADSSDRASASGELSNVMRQLLNDKNDKKKNPPQPPKWQYHENDLRAFSKYERKVETWVLQSKNYMTSSEMGLALYVSLTGEAESEAEHFDLKRVNRKDGVQYILDELRGPLQQRVLFQKRKLLSDFENVKRTSQETARQYLNRYRRIERDLDKVGIQSSAVYDAESRGNRVLERCLLSPDLQRLVLIGAGNALHYEKIYESLCLQFPDFKPSPPLFFPGNQWGNSGKGSKKGSSLSSTGPMTSTSASSQRSSTRSFSGKSSSKGKSVPKPAFQTEHAEGEQNAAGDSEEFEEAVGDEAELGPLLRGIATNLVLGADLSTAWVTEAIGLGGFMVLDAACQRSCFGEPWLKTHSEILQRHDLRVRLAQRTDHFQFGSGAPVASSTRAYFPASMPGQETQGVIFGASVLKTGIPFLASRTLLQRLGCVIDMHTMTLTFTNLGLSMPLTSRHGHRAVSIVHFVEGVSGLSCWKQLLKPDLWHDPDPELIYAPGTINKGSIRDQPPQAIGKLGNASCSALRSFLSMGDCGDQGDDAVLQGLQGDESACEVRPDAEKVDEHVGTSARAPATATRDGSQADDGRSSNLPASRLPSIRQHPRVLQQVQEMPTKIQMGSRQRRLGSTWKSSVATFFALAASLIFHAPAHQGRATQRQGQDYFQEGNYFESQSETESPSNRDLPAGDPLARDGSSILRSGRIPSELRRWSGQIRGLGRGDGLARPCMMDEWQVDSQHVTRVHHVPRKMLFCEADFFAVPDPCPVHFRQLCPECIVEIQYEDGRNQTLTYEWGGDSGAFHMKSAWTGKTIFKLKSSTHAALVANLGRKTLRHSVRQLVNLAQLEHEVLTSSSGSTLNPFQRHKHRSRVDLLETFAGRAGLSLRAKSYGLKALGPIDFNTGYDLSKPEHQAHVDHLLDFYKPPFLSRA